MNNQMKIEEKETSPVTRLKSSLSSGNPVELPQGLSREEKRCHIMNNYMAISDNDVLLDIPEHIWQQCKKYKDCPDGWQETAKKVEAVLLAEGVQIRQMKEKFGGLRVYWDWPEEWNDLEDETFHDKCEQIECLIDIADWVCQRTCMVCGEEGTLRKENWINVLCEGHYNEWKERVYGKKRNEAKR